MKTLSDQANCASRARLPSHEGLRRLSLLALLGALSACSSPSAQSTDGGGGRDVSTADMEVMAPDVGTVEGSLSARHPGDVGLAAHASVLFFDDFEAGWGRWDAPSADTRYLTLESGASAHAGNGYLRSTVTEADLAENMYISSQARFGFERRVPTVYWRFYARMPNVAPNPHHWVRVSAGDEAWNQSGLANTLPPGDGGFWFDFDLNNDDVSNFYVYWHQMRSGRCNDGSTTPGCAGDQGNTYFYGNVFRPPNQDPYPRDAWFCVEMAGHANTLGSHDGWLAFWINNASVGLYAQGEPEGTWLRDSFHEGGCSFSACEAPTPFEGFNFRTEDDVLFKGVFLDAYYERDTTARRRATLEERGLNVSDEQTILYDDVVVATERIGCRVPL